jgi:hypothetical protein
MHTAKIKTQKYWFFILFGSVFATPAVYLFFFSIVSTLHGSIQMQSWPATSATLDAAEVVNHHSDDGTTYEATAKYHYSVNGITYRNNQVFISSGSDNINDFQERFGGKLEQDYYQHRPITIYYNPEDPSNAIIHRQVRWKLLSFKLFFVLIFGLCGFGMMFWGWRGSKINTAPETASQLWLANPAWLENKILSDGKSSALAAILFAAFWNIFSWGMTFFIFPDALRKEGLMVALIVLFFPAVGLGLLYWAWRSTQQWRKFGKTPLQLEPFPGEIGGDVGGKISFRQKLPQQGIYRVTLTLVINNTRTTHKGHSEEQLIWQKEGTATVKADMLGSALGFRFKVPDDLTESDLLTASNPHIWRLTVENKEIGLDRGFEIPVYARSQAADNIRQHYNPQSEYSSLLDKPEGASSPVSAIGDYLPFKDTPGAPHYAQASHALPTVIHYPAFRKPGLHLIFAINGSFFLALGVWLWMQPDTPGPLGPGFCFLGGLVALTGFYGLGHSLTTTLNGRKIQTVTKLFGITISRKTAPYPEIEKIISKEIHRTKSSSDRNWTVHYGILAKLKNGNKIRIALAEGETAASIVRDYFAGLLNLPIEDTPGLANS